MMNFLKEEHGRLLRNCWNLVLEKGIEEICSLVSCCACALKGALVGIQSLSRILVMTSPNTFLGAVLQGALKRQHC
jgi:hypothetical protein